MPCRDPGAAPGGHEQGRQAPGQEPVSQACTSGTVSVWTLVGIVSFAAIESNSNRWVWWLGRAVGLTPRGAAACFVNDFVILGLHEAINICNSENSEKEEKARAAGNRPDPEPLDSTTRRIMDSYR